MDKIPNLNHLNQDLLHPNNIVQEPTASSPRRQWKLVSLEALSIILAFVSGYAGGGVIEGKSQIIIPLAVIAVFFALSSLRALFTDDRSRRFALLVLETIAFFGGVYLVFALQLRFAALAALSIIVFGIWGEAAMASELISRLKLSFFAVSRKRIARLMTGYLLAFIILTIPAWQASPLPVPENQFRAIFNGSVRVIQTVAPGVKFDASVQAFAESIARKQLSGDKHFSELSADQQDAEIRLASAQMIAQAEKNFSLKLTPDMRVSDVFYKYISVTVGNWKTSFGDSFTGIWILVLFVLLRGIASLAVWAASLIAVMLYELMLALGGAAVLGETATKERVVLT